MNKKAEDLLREYEKTLERLPHVTAKPCNECPWLRTSRPGYLGPVTAQEWINTAHSEAVIACHQTIKYNGQDVSEMRQCAGAATFRTNVFKSPRHPNIATSDEPDRETVFGNNKEFLDHHEVSGG